MVDNAYENTMNYYALHNILGTYNINGALILELMFLDKTKAYTLKK